MNRNLIGPARPLPTAPPDTFNIGMPSETSGYVQRPAGNEAVAGLTPQPGEGQDGARARVIDAVTNLVSERGGTPARNG